MIRVRRFENSDPDLVKKGPGFCTTVLLRGQCFGPLGQQPSIYPPTMKQTKNIGVKLTAARGHCSMLSGQHTKGNPTPLASADISSVLSGQHMIGHPTPLASADISSVLSGQYMIGYPTPLAIADISAMLSGQHMIGHSTPLARVESNSPGLHHFCVRQFM